MIKPDATAKGNTGAILSMINAAGFRIVAMKMTKLSKEKPVNFMPCMRPGLFTESWLNS